MANLKNITDVPVAESAEGLNLIANDDGVAKQIPASIVGAQADWAEMDETSPAFIKNKPVEEWDLDMSLIISYNPDEDMMVPSHTINHMVDFALFKEKIVNGINPKLKISCQEQMDLSVDAPYAYVVYPPAYGIVVIPAGLSPWNETQEAVLFNLETSHMVLVFVLLKDGSANIFVD